MLLPQSLLMQASLWPEHQECAIRGTKTALKAEQNHINCGTKTIVSAAFGYKQKTFRLEAKGRVLKSERSCAYKQKPQMSSKYDFSSFQTW